MINSPTANLMLFVIMQMVINSGLVVCHGDNGHIAIETPHINQSNCDSHENHHEEEEETLIHEKHCEPCTDIPIEMNQLIRTVKKEFESTLITVPTYSNLPDLNFQYVKNLAYIPPPPKINPTHNSIRTTILII